MNPYLLLIPLKPHHPVRPPQNQSPARMLLVSLDQMGVLVLDRPHSAADSAGVDVEAFELVGGHQVHDVEAGFGAEFGEAVDMALRDNHEVLGDGVEFPQVI